MPRLAAALALAAVALAACGDDPKPAQGGRWATLEPSPLARTEVAAARVGRHVYVAGGFLAPGGGTTDAVARYDVVRHRWRRVAPLPRPLNHAAAASDGRFLYVVGGYAGDRSLTEEVRTLYRYDPRRDRWTRLRDAPTARGALAAGVVGRRLIVVGGAIRGRALQRAEAYDLRTRRWRRLPPMRTAREHLGVAVARGRLWAVAGRTNEDGNFTTVESYDPRRRRWRAEPSLAKARGGNAAAAVGRSVVAVGGEESAGTIAEVEVLRPGARRWRPLPDLRTPRHGLGAVGYRGRVLVVEGGPEPGFSYADVLEALRVGTGR